MIFSLLMDPFSLYFHIPFCTRRCSYCDFNTYAGQEVWIERYMDALQQEVEIVGRNARKRIPVHTIFWGGGTPSLVPPRLMERVLAAVKDNFDLQPLSEMTLEANPGTVELNRLSELRMLGFNRLSLGMQSAHPDELRLLGRLHDTLDVIQAVKWSRQAGFDNINLDLIYGLPSQTLERWQETIEFALRLNPEHLSLYSLTVEEGTPLYEWANRGLVTYPDDDLAADMYESAGESLERAGYFQYEISNWGLRGNTGNPLTCQHNLQYWRNLPYLGFGAGAHGYAAGIRYANVKGIQEYIRKFESVFPQPFPASPAVAERTTIDKQVEMQETLMVGLRLVEEGVSAAGFSNRFGVSIEQVFGKIINRLKTQRLLEGEERIRLTRRGRLLGNQVFLEFVGD